MKKASPFRFFLIYAISIIVCFSVRKCQGQDSSGIYLPVISSPAGLNMIAQQAHFVKTDSEVIIYGTVFANGFPTVGKPYQCTISTPFPNSVFSYSVIGSGTVYQSNNGTVQTYINNQSGKPTMGWTPTSSNPALIRFNFIFTISP